MKKNVALILTACITVGLFSSCAATRKPTRQTTDDTLTSSVQPRETPTSTLPATQADVNWQPAALEVMRTANVSFSISGLGFNLTDLTQDGIPEIIMNYDEFEVGGIYAIWTWYNGGYTSAYQLVSYNELVESGADMSSVFNPHSIRAFRNTQTDEIEFWDLGSIDCTLEQYRTGDLWPEVGAVNDQIARIRIIDGKMSAEKHEELKRFMTYGMSEDELMAAWDALQAFRNDFRSTHDMTPVDVYSTGVHFYDGDFKIDYNTNTFEIDSSRLQAIIDSYQPPEG